MTEDTVYMDSLQYVADQLPTLSGCTGCWIALDERRIHLNHDGDTCPVHERGDDATND